MRTKTVAVALLLLLFALLAPAGVWAKRVTAGGSVTITSGSPLIDQIVVTAITSNPGIEKTIVQQLPLPGPIWVLPFIVNQEKGNAQPGDMDTTLMIVNTTAGDLEITITLRGLDGSFLSATSPTLAVRETKVIPVSDLLP